MSNSDKNSPDQNKKQDEDQSASTEQSSADRKNESAVNGTPTATERVKSNAGDGPANEGTNVSYDSER